MSLSSDLISRFVTATKDNNSYKGETSAYGTIVVYGEDTYVKLDGSELLTPIVSTTEVNDGERVVVSLKNHTATVTGNIDNPAVGVRRAEGMESRIEQTAEQIRLEVSNEVAKLESSITLTASEIRSEVEDEINGINSLLTQTASDIRAEVSDEASRLEAQISLNSNKITTLVTNQDEFSKFQQTVEGFSFMNKGGTVKISDGDINLTGAITFSDLSSDVASEIENAMSTANSAWNTANSAYSTADTASYNAGRAISKAETAEEVAAEAKKLAQNISLPDYLHETYIDSTTIVSPVIVGGTLYAVGQDAWTEMTSSGLSIYTDGIAEPKIQLLNYDKVIYLVLGSGAYTDGSETGQFYITKYTTGTDITYYSGDYSGLYASLIFTDSGNIIARRENPDGTVNEQTLI